MEKLIKKLFSAFLGQEVRMINLPDDEIDMGVYVVHDKKTRRMNENELSEMFPDYTITRLGSQWVYQIGVHKDALVRNNEVISDATTTFTDSINTYKTAELALENLILYIVREKANSVITEFVYD